MSTYWHYHKRFWLRTERADISVSEGLTAVKKQVANAMLLCCVVCMSVRVRVSMDTVNFLLIEGMSVSFFSLTGFILCNIMFFS